MNPINKELAEKLIKLVLEDSYQASPQELITVFFESLPPIYYEKTGCKPCWRCHGTGTNESMS